MELVNTDIEQSMKASLWRRFGSAEHPTEWDGIHYGGGTMSQRYWEYMKAIELLNLDGDSVVLDIGGGSRKTGTGFFAGLIKPYVRKVIIVDAAIAEDAEKPENVEFVREYVGAEELGAILSTNLNITHIISLSVLEHVDDEMRRDMMKVINEWFNGMTLVATFEYHARTCYFDSQLTARSVSEMFKPLTNFYLSRFESSPVLCENAFSSENDVPRWYPVAVKFESCM